MEEPAESLLAEPFTFKNTASIKMDCFAGLPSMIKNVEKNARVETVYFNVFNIR